VIQLNVKSIFDNRHKNTFVATLLGMLVAIPLIYTLNYFLTGRGYVSWVAILLTLVSLNVYYHYKDKKEDEKKLQ